MKIKTLDDLSDTLSTELAWRKKEFTEIKYLVETSHIPRHKKNVFIRSGIAMIYAHWEGYLKLAGRYYLEYIYYQRVKNSDLEYNFLTISLVSKTSLFDSGLKFSAYEKVVNFFNESLDSQASIPYKNIIDTESNLSSKVLKEIIWCLGLNYAPFEPKEKLIDQRMLAKRNNIAHGEYLAVSEKDVVDLRDEILSLMNEFKNQIENDALNKAFLK